MTEEPLRDHVRKLVREAGGVRSVARAAGVSQETVHKIHDGHPGIPRRETAQALYDVLPEDFSWTPDPVILAAMEASRVHPRTVRFPYGEKTRYASFMIQYHKWTRRDLRRSIGMRRLEIERAFHQIEEVTK